ncbi:MAG TPA: Maf family nucleotide pyrophosphatase [Rhizomicrobium sp.]|nr:Maf family nucleotide pyrophosphatase [Rhizomicrobium sp.]
MIVLASQSPVRARLLHEAGVAFEIVSAPVDEDAIKKGLLAAGQAPAAIAQRLAEAKALSGSNRYPQALVVGADQVLELDGDLVSKSSNMAEASSLLEQLRGRAHRLISAAALARNGKVVWQQADAAVLTMRPFSDEFLSTYLEREGEAILASVGCYHLEGIGAQLFEKIDGDYFTILGLPLISLLAALREQGEIRA